MGGTYTKAVWYRYGKENFTRSGYEKAKANFVPGQLESLELQGKVYVVTGANSGLGRDLAEWLASKNATVYMVCRNQGRGESAQQKIQEKTGNQNVKLLIGDCGLRSDVDKVVSQLTNLESSIDALVCNAGALLNSYQATPEGLEVTLATHLVYGTYYITEKLMPLLKQAAGRSRVVVVSSGGMYQERLSSDVNMTPDKYDGVAAYSRAKRAQVELVEVWSRIYASSGVKFVSCHPGWADTPGVDEAIPGFKKFVGKEFRDSWQGAEGICWLTAIDQQNLVSGEFYLDRQVVPKHLPSSCIHTRCDPTDVDWLTTQLRQWAPLQQSNYHQLQQI